MAGPLRGRRVVRIAAGSNYSAAVTADGELYTWGVGAYGRLGHGGLDDCYAPTLVTGLLAGQRVVDVACGSGDAQTLAVTAEGLVYSWGDGDYGKLGRGGSDGCRWPRVVERLGSELGVCRVVCGSQFSAALTASGQVPGEMSISLIQPNLYSEK